MEITIELVNDNAVGLLQYLEKLNIIRFVKPKKIATDKDKTEKLTKSRFAGRISPETVVDLQQQLHESRQEWQH